MHDRENMLVCVLLLTKARILLSPVVPLMFASGPLNSKMDLDTPWRVVALRPCNSMR